MMGKDQRGKNLFQMMIDQWLGNTCEIVKSHSERFGIRGLIKK